MRGYLKLTGFIFTISFITALPCWAQGPVKIGVIDGKRCIEQTEAGKKTYSLFRERYAKDQKELEAKGSTLKKLQEEYTKKSEVLAADVKREKEKEIMRKEEDLRDQLRERSEKFRQDEQEAFQKLTAEIFEAASAIGREQGLTLIMEAKSGVVYFNPAIDITDQVIKRHNARKTTAK
jgi:outer membrane protein